MTTNNTNRKRTIEISIPDAITVPGPSLGFGKILVSQSLAENAFMINLVAGSGSYHRIGVTGADLFYTFVSDSAQVPTTASISTTINQNPTLPASYVEGVPDILYSNMPSTQFQIPANRCFLKMWTTGSAANTTGSVYLSFAQVLRK